MRSRGNREEKLQRPQNFFNLPVINIGISVKGLPCFLLFGILLAASMVCPRAGAQAFGLSVTPSANTLLVSNSVTYTIDVTNLTGVSITADVWMTNSFSAPFKYITASSSQFVTVTNDATNVIFDLGPIDLGVIVQVDLTVQPTTTGSFTNSVVVSVPNTSYTVSTNAVVQVTNVVNLADLGVTMIGPKQVVISNDWMTYGVTITNAGPNAASSVSLTNALPSGVLLKSISPNLPYTPSGSNMIISLGALTNGGTTNLFFTVQPTNIATLPFSASVGAAGITDTNVANNFATTNITVTNYLSGPFAVSTNSGQVYNPQNGLVEQFITVTNNTNYTANAVRVVVTGLTATNRLFNAVGTNNGNPFVYYSASVGAGQSATLLLQYAANAYFPLTNGQLQAFAVKMPNWTPPSMTGTSTNVTLSRIVTLANGNVLIEWSSTPGKTYTVVYASDLSFSNARIAPPSIVAPANRTQWIDYGPPTTASLPADATRFYRVYQNP